MNLSKLTIFLTNILLLGMILSCSNSKKLNNNNSTSSIEFTEERRLNFNSDLKEATIINSSQKLIALYGKMEKPNAPRSAPIPAFDEATESILVIKPKLKDYQYADVEILSIDKLNSKLIVNYKEVENWEFTEYNWSDPIVILRVSEKPSEIQLNKIN